MEYFLLSRLFSSSRRSLSHSPRFFIKSIIDHFCTASYTTLITNDRFISLIHCTFMVSLLIIFA
ncbi:hypothetical protein DSB74_26475 [Salmonella enterica subsp. enterica serovar Typhimurium]|nr:hypothetical protein DSB74_26475 [Salmonella enterica subsp. enterica serovar Typhimurium]